MDGLVSGISGQLSDRVGRGLQSGAVKVYLLSREELLGSDEMRSYKS